MIGTIVGILLIGALLGLVFSRRGEEGDGAIQGAKKAGGCLVIVGILAVVLFVVLIIALGV